MNQIQKFVCWALLVMLLAFALYVHTQNAKGFKSDKYYNWTVTYGGQDGLAHGPQDNINPNYTADDYLTSSLSGGQSLGKSTSIMVSVRNAQGSFTTATTYTVHWHYKYENWSPSGGRTYANPEIYSQSATVTPGQSVSLTMTTQNSPITAAGVLAGVVTSASAGVGTAGTTLFVASVPEVALLATLLAAGGYILNIADPPTPQLQMGSTDVGQFASDVALQNAIDNHDTSQTIPEPSSIRVDPAIVNRIESGTHKSDDVYNGLYGTPQVSAHAGRYRFTQMFSGDEYDQSGYKGPVQKSLDSTGSYFFVYRWTFASSGKPGPGQ